MTTTADSKEARKSSTRSPAIFGGVPPRNPNFTGREDLLLQLDERLEPGATAAVLPQTIHGLGGVGKSALAIEYAYRHRSKFDMIWWVPAEREVGVDVGKPTGRVERGGFLRIRHQPHVQRFRAGRVLRPEAQSGARIVGIPDRFLRAHPCGRGHQNGR